MQRPMSSARALEEGLHHVIDIGEGDSPRRKEAGEGWSLWRSVKKHGIHAIPVIVFLCFFILWWSSYPVTLEIKDGQITRIRSNKHRDLEVRNKYRSKSTDNDRLSDTRDFDHDELKILALASPTDTSIPRILTLKNKAEVKSVSPAN